MRISLNLTNFSWPDGVAGLLPVVQAAEDAGVDTVWVPDHLIQADPFASVEEPVLEAYTTLGFLAARTARVRLGTMVTGAPYRPPALLIKAVTTLDVLSGGRAWLGIGSGYHEAEASMMGLPMPPVAERFERLEEILRLAHRMWAGDESPFEGRHYRLTRPLNIPNAAKRPPILIGGSGEKKTLRYVARYGDACNLPDIPDGGATLRHKLAVLAAHCAEEGRPFEAVEKTVASRFDPATLPDRVAELSALGVDHLVLITTGPWTVEAVTSIRL
ncbi:TIGR03560 family F420-dependent LLM class oxidoreductase [Actinophytocola sp. KF-1]